MSDKKQKELEESKKLRENKELDDEALENVAGGTIANVNYTQTGQITDPIKQKI